MWFYLGVCVGFKSIGVLLGKKKEIKGATQGGAAWEEWSDCERIEVHFSESCS